MKNKYLESARTIVSQEGYCNKIKCLNCPSDSEENGCLSVKYPNYINDKTRKIEWFKNYIKENNKPMENKVIFESEEDCRVFFKLFFGIDDIGVYENERLMDMKDIINRCKVLGYIRKSPVEEAETVTYAIGSFFSENDEPYELSIEEFNTMYNAIQYLKAENERYKSQENCKIEVRK